MGGNALKHYETRRLNFFEYFGEVQLVLAKFKMRFGFTPCPILAYRNKQSFGDADILLDRALLPSDWVEQVKEEFELDETRYVKNGDVLSIGFHNFQIDLIVVEDVPAARFYFSYNDFGNLIGRLGHKLGIKIGHRGISIVVRHSSRSDHILKEIHLSSDYRDALDILGLDVERYSIGFDELEDVFEYVATSKWFNKDIYLFENRNSIAKRRDKKRVSYNAFLKWCEDRDVPNNYQFEQKNELGGYSLRMPYYETIVLQKWPHVKAEVDAVIAQFELDEKFKTVYNGDIVSKQTGYTGKILGAFMAKFKDRITNDVKRVWIERPHLVDLAIAEKFLEVGGVQFNEEKL